MILNYQTRLPCGCAAPVQTHLLTEVAYAFQEATPTHGIRSFVIRARAPDHAGITLALDEEEARQLRNQLNIALHTNREPRSPPHGGAR